MNPYYQDSAVTIYHGDCMAIDLPRSDLALITDPPYGHGYKGINCDRPGNKKQERGRYHEVMKGFDNPFDPLPWLRFPEIILWGANHYADKCPASPAWLVWDKRDGTAINNFSDCELAWTNLGGSARIFRHMWNGLCRDSEIGIHLHPTQKPLELMTWCINKTTHPILDPFMGSGTTLRAAKDLGRKAIGIEIEEKYCEIAARRMAQEVFDFNGSH